MIRTPGVLLLAFACISIAGCDDEADRQGPLKRQLEVAQEREAKANQEAEQARADRERDRRVLAAGEREARADLDTVMVLWIGTFAALVLTMVLLAREVAARRLPKGLPKRGGRE